MNKSQFANLSVAQLIDANLDRAKEGLRVVEDWCRYGLHNQELIVTLKDWRQQLGQFHHFQYKKSRSTTTDEGIGLTHPAQSNRRLPEDVVAANCSRVQEALRVLEEFSRCSSPKLSSTAANIRYGLYQIELEILNVSIHSKRIQKLNCSQICLITSPHPKLYNIINSALNAGIRMIQYRSKSTNDLQKIKEAQDLRNLCKKYDALFIVNDRIDIALAVQADGVHLGQGDFPPNIARSIIGEEFLIGKSTHCLKQLNEAEEESCDYLGVGPINKTETKPDIHPVGINYATLASKSTVMPWFAIGGINKSNVKEIKEAGAKRIAICKWIINSENPEKTSKEIVELFK